MQSAAVAPCPYRDASLPLLARVDDLLSRLTLDEKCAQLTYDAPAIDRLGVPPHNWWSECLHGVGRAGLATVFPQPIGLAATFDPEFVHRVATAISDEARAKHHAHAARGDFGIYKGLSFWSPNINIFRDPRWGRGHETFGECPYLTSRLGVAFVRGLQGDDPRWLKVIATPKHMAVHSGPEIGRHGFDSRVSEQDLHATYLPAFRACVVEGKAFSVMGAYNRLNGVPCCASPLLLQKLLRDDWGFEGYTVSDCGAITDLHAHHKVTRTPAESAALALSNGLDLCCGEDYAHLRSAVDAGFLSDQEIDRAVSRLLLARFKLGMFDPPETVPHAQIPYDVVDCDEHRALSLEAARRSIVLLKNAGNLLPLSKEVGSIAVIGPNADARDVLLGNYHGTPPFVVSPADGIRAKVGPRTKVQYVRGCTHLRTENPWIGKAKRGFAEAVIAAERADVVVLCLGLSTTIEGEEGDAMNSDAGGDRTAIELPAIQQELLEAIVATGTPVVLVLIAGSALAIPWAHDNVPAIVQQFYPGQAGGTALADVLFGDENPSGRMPITVYNVTTDLPPFQDYAMRGRTYRYFDGAALYPFGFGLSYSRFEYSALRTEQTGTGIAADVCVRNIGSRAGRELMQAYIERDSPADGVPQRQLAGVQSIELQPGESRSIEFVLTREQFEAIDSNGRPTTPTGPLQLCVGGSQSDARSIELGAPSGLRIPIATSWTS